MHIRALLPLAVCLIAACSDDKDVAITVTSAATFTSGTPVPGDSEADTDTDSAAPATGGASDPTSSAGSTSESATSEGPTSASASNTSNGETSNGSTSTAASADDSTSSTSEPVPTDGPGVLPGETGLDAFCRRYVECGGTYYDGAQSCIDETLDYWGACPSRRAALDDFGACMSDMDCSDWNPDAFNPASTPCREQWDAVGAAEPC